VSEHEPVRAAAQARATPSDEKEPWNGPGNSASRKDFFTQPAVNGIDDAIHRRAGMKPNAQIGPAYKKQGVYPENLSWESRGFDPRDNRKGNPGSVAPP